MNWKHVAVSIVASALMLGCGVSQSDYDKMKAESDSLRGKLEECEYGAEKLAALIDNAYREGDYAKADELIRQLASRHPESPKNHEFNILLPIVKQRIEEQRAQTERAELEKYRLANANNLGIWEVRYFVNEFRERTSKRYITNSMPIKGTFSNTATQDSDLNIEFIISSATSVTIQLYEYAGNNPVKGYSEQTYHVAIKDRAGQKFTLEATNYSDRLSFSSSDSKIIHGILLKGGQVQLWIRENDTPTSQYHFTIINADWYDNAFAQLMVK